MRIAKRLAVMRWVSSGSPRWVGVPAWAWLFLLHEGGIFFCWVLPYPQVPLAYLKAQEAFYPTGHFWFRWDSLWYMVIAVHGYGHQPASRAFFPWVPLLIHVTGVWGAWALTQGAFAGSLVLAARLFGRLGLSQGHERYALLLFAMNPAMIFYATLYAEPWTVFWTLVALECGHRQRWMGAAGASAFAAITQATGLLVGIFPLLVWGSAVHQRAWKASWGPMFWGVGGLVGLTGYTVYLGVRWHQPFAWMSAQGRFWGGHWVWPWQQWMQGLLYGEDHGAILLRGLLWLAMTLFGIGTVRLWVGLRGSALEMWALALYGTVGVLVALSFEEQWPLHSAVRIASMYFPMYVGLSRLPAWLRSGAAVMLGSLAVLGTILFTHGWYFQ